MSYHNHDEEIIKKMQEQSAFDKANRGNTIATAGGTEASNKSSPPSSIIAGAKSEYLRRERWVSVKTRLPEKDQKVIVIQNPKTTATREPLFSVFDGKEFVSPGATIDGIHACLAYWSDIILWQPLPEPPSEP